MDAIRAHFDGSVIVPDEPITVPPQSQVVVLIDSAAGSAVARLESETRQYYESLEVDPEDEGWGVGVARDSQKAWDEE